MQIEQSTIQRARAASGLTQEEAAALVHTPLGTWRRWEQGVSPMPFANFELFLIKTNQFLLLGTFYQELEGQREQARAKKKAGE